MSKEKTSSYRKVSDKIIKSFRHDAEIKAQYFKMWVLNLLGAIVTALVFAAAVALEYSEDDLWLISNIWGIPLEFAATAILLKVVPSYNRETYRLSDGSVASGHNFIKFLYFTISFIPLYLCVWLRFHIDAVKAVFMTPIVMAIAFGITIFESSVTSRMTYSPHDPHRRGVGVSVAELKRLRENQKSAGLDPDKLPLCCFSDSVLDLSITDWRNIKRDMELAGYDIGK